MQFFKSAVLFVVAFATVALAAPGGGGEGPPPCKPLLQSCSVNSECCGDLCLAGVILFAIIYVINRSDASILLALRLKKSFAEPQYTPAWSMLHQGKPTQKSLYTRPFNLP